MVPGSAASRSMARQNTMATGVDGGELSGSSRSEMSDKEIIRDVDWGSTSEPIPSSS